jgi:KDO2-lipid IV(A) lauroyltransferase
MTRGSIRGWFGGRLLVAGSWLACRLPERPLVRAAELTGDLWYRTSPERAAQARRNLRRVAVACAERGRGSEVVRAAATDPRALELLVRRAFRHLARYYLEVARTPAIRGDDLDELIHLETPEAIAAAFTPGRPVIFLGLHFGSLELPALFLASRVGGAVAPMETLDDPGLQAWFVRTRGAAGVRIVGLREARRELLAALREGTSVGLVGDRDLTGGGAPVPLFGAPAILPLGPALLAVESGAPLCAVGVRRVGVGHYRGRLLEVAVPTDGTRRDRVTAAMPAIADAFERIIEDAPEQWWAVFFPIWPDLDTAVGEVPATDKQTTGVGSGSPGEGSTDRARETAAAGEIRP